MARVGIITKSVISTLLSTADWKTTISFGSAIVAAVSAYIAYNAKVQTRKDLFYNQRDTLILTMANNNNRGEHLALQAAMARDEIERILPSLTGDEAITRANDFLTAITVIQNVPRTLQGREYKESDIDKLPYAEDSLEILRLVSRGEQKNANLLALETHDVVFRHIERFVSRHEKHSTRRLG